MPTWWEDGMTPEEENAILAAEYAERDGPGCEDGDYHQYIWGDYTMSGDDPKRPRSNMNTYTITLERISTGERAPSMVTRQPTEEAAREYAEAAIRQSSEPDDLRVVEIHARP